MIKDRLLNVPEGWVRKSIPFQNDRVVIKHHALGWNFEYLLFDNQITSDEK